MGAGGCYVMMSLCCVRCVCLVEYVMFCVVVLYVVSALEFILVAVALSICDDNTLHSASELRHFKAIVCRVETTGMVHTGDSDVW